LRGWEGRGGEMCFQIQRKKPWSALLCRIKPPRWGIPKLRGLTTLSKAHHLGNAPQQLENVLNCHIRTMDLDLMIIIIIIVVILWLYIDFSPFFNINYLVNFSK
jgi:hypothetical protein